MNDRIAAAFCCFSFVLLVILALLLIAYTAVLAPFATVWLALVAAVDALAGDVKTHARPKA